MPDIGDQLRARRTKEPAPLKARQQTSIYVVPEDWKAIREIALHEDVSGSVIVAALIRRFLEASDSTRGDVLKLARQIAS